ncbi:hypothetical protein C7T94_13440 [Pedobacter yulinensis]|uniref:Uncharacterized protein n=1 Tax=Pedobacter yulinensis TaxID=2126353 RepID=A0A2T3HM86_9SPHI|nr:hypothetical protein [Pedobacter yulinensis]PST83550.1 hypothetical protein C7T94_13440 [Pedobacter yulinensis]
MQKRLPIQDLNTLEIQKTRLMFELRRQEKALKLDGYHLLEHVPAQVLEQSLAPMTAVAPVLTIKNPVGKLLSGLALKLFPRQGFLQRLGITFAAKRVGAAIEKKVLQKSHS